MHYFPSNKSKLLSHLLLEERFMIEEITLDLYQRYGNVYREELKKMEDAYNESGKRVSNLEKCVDVTLEMAGNLYRMWEVLTFKDRVIMQRVVFPEGIQYDKKTNRCRTKEVNFFIRYFSQLSKDAAEIKSGDSNFIFEIPALVEVAMPVSNQIMKDLGKIKYFNF